MHVPLAQVHASADTLRLITFDADGTLYADGAHIEQDSLMISLIVALMRAGVHVAIVTAAGYPGAPLRQLETRLRQAVRAVTCTARAAADSPCSTQLQHSMPDPAC